MTERPPYAARPVAIPDHLWETFQEMAAEMGADRDGLVCQAMFMFARLNGFLAAPAQQKTPSGQGTAFAPAVQADTGPASTIEGRAPSGSAEPTGPMATAAVARVAHEDAEAGEAPSAAPPASEEEGDGVRGQLYVLTDGGALDRVIKDRFVIGRGKHCDFVIQSGKVSREHAVVVRVEDDWFIEDLGSSNGTWFNKQRVKRRQVEDGDEYYICNEKIKFVLR
jgi:hypothetical protein